MYKNNSIMFWTAPANLQLAALSLAAINSRLNLEKSNPMTKRTEWKMKEHLKPEIWLQLETTDSHSRWKSKPQNITHL